MRIKNILSSIAFIAAFILSVSLVGLPKDNFYSRFTDASNFSQNRQNIRLLLRQDISNGMLRDRTIYSLEELNKNSDSSFDIAPFADATEEYVESSESIDDTDLPADFQTAWHNHLDAWREQADFLNQVKGTVQEEEINGQKQFTFSLNPHEENVYQNQTDEINRTWHEVLRIAKKYDVDAYRYY
ncbi:MAG: hypothetical protein ACR2GD_12185 [Pyrinomonadaceae bacterium]